MRRSSRRPGLGLIIPRGPSAKFNELKSIRRAEPRVSLSPCLSPSTPPALPTPQLDQTSRQSAENKNLCVDISGDSFYQIDGFVLLEEVDVASSSYKVRRAVCKETGENYLCKIIPADRCQAVLEPYYRTSHIFGVAGPERIILAPSYAYIMFRGPCTDLHSYVRAAGKVPESDARAIFGQIALAVKQCHEAGLVLRDIKLRKCVFTEQVSTIVKLTGLEDSHIISDQSDDWLEDKHGCPAYVSPEILHSVPSEPGRKGGYSGRGADSWSLGVILYTMLVGRYPFQDSEPLALFSRISIGKYPLPDTLSPRARCLIRGLLCKDPTQRLPVSDILHHPWLTCCTTVAGRGFTGGPLDEIGPGATLTPQGAEQAVPEWAEASPEDLFMDE